MSVTLTCTHDVVSEERGSEPEGQHEQVAGDARVQLPEACGVAAEVGEGSRHQHAVRMEAQDIVVSGVQVSRLHQLGGRKGNGIWILHLHHHPSMCLAIHHSLTL